MKPNRRRNIAKGQNRAKHKKVNEEANQIAIAAIKIQALDGDDFI